MSARRAGVTPAADAQPFDWDVIGDDEYQLAGMFALSRAQVRAIRTTVERAWEIVRAVAPIARALPDAELAEFGIPEAARTIVRLADPAMPETLVGRFDLIETATGYRVIEFNAETPYFIVEAHTISGSVARLHGFGDPNDGCAATLGAAIGKAIGADDAQTHVAVAAPDVSREDRGTALFLRDTIDRASRARVTVAPLRSLRVREDGLWSAAGRIDVLYRLYPLEQLALDRPAARIFEFVRTGRLRLLNPASALVSQSKMLGVLIWGLATRDDVLTPAQCAAVRDIFLPTFADLPRDGHTYVRKSVLGREGASFSIIGPDGTTRISTSGAYDGQPQVFQRYLEMPRYTARTPSGKAVHGHVLTTCFIVAGRPGAVGIRIGGEITDGRAHFAPVGYPP